MKYVVVLCDGMADEPLEELGGMTPLEKAHTPNLDRMAQISEIGMVQTVPDGMAPGSDTANLSVIGYDNLTLCQYTLPKLTSVSQNIPQKAKLATSLLLEKIRTGSVSSSCQAALDVEIVDRQSVISLY